MASLKRTATSARQGSLLALLDALGLIELPNRDQPGWTDPRADRALKAATKAARCRTGRR